MGYNIVDRLYLNIFGISAGTFYIISTNTFMRVSLFILLILSTILFFYNLYVFCSGIYMYYKVRRKLRAEGKDAFEKLMKEMQKNQRK